MPKLTHKQLHDWYEKFKKAVYEGANIDMLSAEDLGRLKIAYPTKWDVNDPTGAEGDYMYACVPHNELEYEVEPPDYAQSKDRLQWLVDNLRFPSTDDEIQKLYDMSRDGRLMAIQPGHGDFGVQLVYTNELNEVRVSRPMVETEQADPFDLDPEDRIPDDPGNLVKEPNPADFGLLDAPRKPVPPKNMNPGFFSWLGSLIGINTDYKKLKTYREESATYDARFQEWLERLDPANEGENDPRRISDYLAARQAREQYVAAVHAFWEDPIGKCVAMCRGFSAYKTNLLGRPDRLGENIHAFQAAEVEFLKKQNKSLPQGKIRESMDDAITKLAWIDRTKHVVTNLVGNKPRMQVLKEWIQKKIFDPAKHHPQDYDVPRHPDYDNIGQDERVAYRKKWEKLAEVAGFAAASHTDVCGKPLIEGFNEDQSAQLHYTQTLFNVFTSGRYNSDFYVGFLEGARMKAKSAIEAYHRGELEPLAEIMASGIRRNNHEAACRSSITTADTIGTCYLIDRMWNVLKDDENLLKATGLTADEIEETKANAALYHVAKRGLEAKKELCEYALHQRKMTPAQVKQAGADFLFMCHMGENLHREFEVRSEANFEHPTVKAAQEKMQDYKNPKSVMRGNNEIDLFMLQQPGYNCLRNLVRGDFINDVKATMMKESGLEKLTQMSREELGKLVGSESAFVKMFSQPPISMQKVQEPAKVKELQNEVAPQQPQQQQQQKQHGM